MQRLSRNEGWEVRPQQLQRNRSFSSDRNSMPASLASPPSVAPDPAYIAGAAASQIITNDQQSQIDDWFDDHGGKTDGETAVISSASLSLINSFLDHLLFSILACARSTAIVALRPAVAEVLKPRLAKDAIDGADEELREFLGGEDDEDISIFQDGLESRGKWDLNLAWRRTRLRCMVFTRLGDMEEEDEENYIERERMEEVDEDHSHNLQELAIISPAASIFLTSVLEFIGEHALTVAGEAAFNRREIRRVNNEEHVVVEDIDAEKLAFNPTLGRLWRSWKKRVRAPSISYSRPISRDFMRRRAASLSGSPSVSELGDPNHDVDQIPRSSVAETLREEQETNPSTVLSSDGQVNSCAPLLESDQTTASKRTGIRGRSENRRRSKSLHPHPLDLMLLTNSTGTHPPNDASQPRPEPLSQRRRPRSSSLPSPELSPFFHLFREQFFTSIEGPDPLPQPTDQSQADGDASYLEDVPISMVEGEANSARVHLLDGESEPKKLDFLYRAGRRPVELTSHMESSYLPANHDILIPASPRSISASHEAETKYPSPMSIKEVARGGIDLTKAQKIHAAPANDGHRVEYPSPTGNNLAVNTLSEKRTQFAWNDVPPKNLPIMQGGRMGAGAELAPGNEGPRVVKRNGTIFYEVASIPHRDPDSRDLTRPRKDAASRDVRLSPTTPKSPPCESEHGAPPLTPLRELVEAAHDTSDDSSSFAPSQEDVLQSETFLPTESVQEDGPPSPASNTFAHFFPSRYASKGNKSSEKREELPPVNTAGAERAVVQRIIPSPVLARDGFAPLARTSTSSNRPLTAATAATAASGTSQLSHKIKTLIGRESTEGNRHLVLRRTSSEGSGIGSDSQPGNTPKEFDKQRSFEQLIKSDETIQYTLTPKSVRDMEGAAKVNSPGVREVTEVSRHGELAEPDSTRQATGRTVVSLKSSNGVWSNPAMNTNRQGSASSQPPSSQSDKGQSQGSSTSLNSRSIQIIPRDARPKPETTAAIADFIRTTGPEREPESSTIPAPEGSSRRHKATNSTSRTSPASQQGRPRKISKSIPLILPRAINTSPSTKSASSSPSKRPVSKLQAREATVTHDEKTSDLIDFIRQGPAYDKGDGNHRISRAVAPFRTTMDSDEIQALGDGKGKDTLDATNSISSTQDSLAPVKSTHSSLNSRTALIDNAKRSKARNAPALGKPPRPDEPPHPIRKQRRDKDPYGIDTESDEEDEHASTPTPEQQEEYLIDFLRSVTPPPPKPVIPSAFDGIQRPSRSTVQKKSSGPNMRESFSQNGSMPLSSQMPRSSQTVQPSVRETRRTEAGQQPLTSRAVSPHLITQVGTKYDTYKPTRPTYAAHMDRERNGSLCPRQLPRAEREPDSGMSDLVDFFKNSAPPPSPPFTKPTPAVRVAKGESGFSKIFSRKKRMTGRA